VDVGAVRPLKLFEDYSRRDVHDIFTPNDPFTAGAGTWGLAGIVEHQPGDFVLFVTFGREQGDHKFDEGVTLAGVVTWQSQPNQSLTDAQVQRLIAHDADRGNVRLFLRTRGTARSGTPMPYTYLGRLAYVTHDAERERPVYFQWQLIDWPPPGDVLQRMELVLVADSTPAAQQGVPEVGPALTETAAPEGRARTGAPTTKFRGRKSGDRSIQDAKNRALGRAGELAVVAREHEWLRTNGRADLADRVRHVADIEGR
jgi:hypothetical protein